MSVRVTLHVEGVDLDDEAAMETIAEHLSDVLWHSVDGAVYAEAETSDPVETAVELARRIRCQLNARVLRVHRDLVSASDIAVRTGFSREAVRKWANGSVKFPQPLDTVGAGSTATRVWLWSEVADWVRNRYALDVDDDGLSEAMAAEIDAHLHRVPSIAGAWQVLPESSAERREMVIHRVPPARSAQLRIEPADARYGQGAHVARAEDLFCATA